MLNSLRELRRTFFDIRPSELRRTVFVALYLFFILLAYYILKPVSRALFLNQFDLDKLPLLYMLLAPAGGTLAYVYSRLAVRVSLTAAVNAATAFSVFMTVSMGYLLYTGWTWTFYAFNVWVSMFSIMLVTQGWIIASNVFTTREAKRVYGILGLGAVLGAFVGGTYTRAMVRVIGENNLIITAAGFTVVAYLMFRGLLKQEGVKLQTVRGADEEEASFSVKDIAGDFTRNRHLQVIMGIILLTFIVDVIVEYQFQAFAKERFQGQDLTAFMASFQGVYLNIVNFVFQFFLTAAMVRWLGVGGVLQIMPVTMSAAAVAIVAAPGLLTTSIARLTEAATRYTFNRTGMELLYLPLPLELRNRTKAFLDIFVDRFGRGIGGVLLYLFTVSWNIAPRDLSFIVFGFTAAWGSLSWLAQREYLRSIRKRLEARTLDIGSIRLSVTDPAMISALERATAGDSGRQAAYALSLLGSAEGYNVMPLAEKLVSSSHAEVRAKAFEIAGERRDEKLLPQALAEIRSSRRQEQAIATEWAVRYALAVSPESDGLAARLVEHPSQAVAETTLKTLVEDPARANRQLTIEMIVKTASAPEPARRRLAAIALRTRGDEGTAVLHSLLADGERAVAEAALETAGILRRRSNLPHIIERLADVRLRGAAIDALAAYGSLIAGTLRDLMDDPETQMVLRLRIPKVLARMKDQRAADELLAALPTSDLAIRAAILQALARLRRDAPELQFGPAVIEKEILEEVRTYFALWASFIPFQPEGKNGAVMRLLTSTLEERLKATLERLFHLLGLKYPQREMQSAYNALLRTSPEDHSAAIEFLDSVLERELKRYLMPLLDEPGRLSARGRELFGIEPRTAEAALKELLRSGDAWLVSCAVATIVELKMRSLRDDIVGMRGRAGREVDLVVDQALANLS